MRNEPTHLERRSGEALIAHLSERYVAGNAMFGDRPDLSFSLDNHQVHFEITSLLPSDVHHPIKTFFQKLYRNGVSIGRVIVPMEPDMWLKAAIERKWASVQKYPNFQSLRNLNLLVHLPGILSDSIDYSEPGFLNALHYGHARSEHGFVNVYYWSGKSIVQFVTPSLPVPEVKHDVTDGYPAWITWSYTGVAGESRGQLEGKALPLITPDEHTKVVAPMTPQFKGLKPKLPKGDLRVKFVFNRDDVEFAGAVQDVADTRATTVAVSCGGAREVGAK